MRRSGLQQDHQGRWALREGRYVLLLLLLLGLWGQLLKAQLPAQESIPERIQRLNDAMVRTQAQLEQSQRDMEEMRRQLVALEQQMAGADAPGVGSLAAQQPPPAQGTAAMDQLRDQQAMQETQIATQEQTKVESGSKYPVKLSGLVLLNGFVNTERVDVAATPTLALPGAGSTGASVRQTVLGLDARGPHLFGARSHADLRVDFDGSATAGGNGNVTSTSNAGTYSGGSTLLRLRTAHAALDWEHAQAFFALDRPILNPNAPDSLTAVAEPALAWSGNLWAWNPQVGVTQDIALGGASQLRLQAALIDVADPPVTPVLSSYYPASTVTSESTAEQSRWPGTEARVALLGSKHDEGTHVGIGGYFAPHRTSTGYRFNSWAGTVDYRLSFPGRLDLRGNVYRGLALGGLGAGGFKDFVYGIDTDTYSQKAYYRALDDVGGWAQLKESFSERLEFNVAFGVDEVFARQLRPYAGSSAYQNLARNRTFTGNVIYSPSAYLLFSLEYRRLESSPVVGSTAGTNVIGLGAGYKF
jgi:hypothetical protein